MAFCRNPLRRSHSFAFKEGLKLKFMSRGSQPNLVAYADSEAQQDSSNKDDSRKKAGSHMRNVSLYCNVASSLHHTPADIHAPTVRMGSDDLLLLRVSLTLKCSPVKSPANPSHHFHVSDRKKSCP